MKKIFKHAAFIGCLICTATNTVALEEILNFHSDIVINKDRSLSVKETIRVRAEGNNIRRGIYRDFPTDYRDRLGNRYRVGFEVLSVSKDGTSEPFKSERIKNGVRVYIGQEGVVLSTGIYEYEITYRTDRQLGFFKKHDELYWNVTGNGWRFPIARASATIKLPRFVDPAEMATNGYTGAQRAVEKNFSDYIDDLSVAHFETTSPLGPNEGLTVVLSWPKGVITAPTTSERLAATTRDNAHILAGLIGLAGLCFYYLFIWDKVGRDPLEGVVVAHYEPPPGYSPASMRYIENMSYDEKCFSAALINLAVKGFLTIEEDGNSYLLRKTGQEVELAPGESSLIRELFGSGDEMQLKQKNHKTISDSLNAHEQALSDDYENKYFKTNRKFFFFGVGLSVGVVALTAMFATSTGNLYETLFLAFWSSIWWSATGGALVKSWGSIKHAHSGFTRASALIRIIFLIPFVGAGIFALVMFGGLVSWSVIIFLLIIVAINILFYQLLKAPTKLGRKLLDKVAGFKHYVDVAEKHELDYRNPAGRTPELFERYLPYALALGIEQQWSEQFHEALAQSSNGDGEYSPVWYSGSHWHPTRAGHFGSSLAGALTGAIASSATAPGSSSGSGGGGFSGGGGGGGGGGGW
ncbi:MAG: DUF2207 domain-containing protein [Gammaproteobacteria bacterium]